MELRDVKGIDAIIEQAGIYSTISEQLADNLQDFKKQVQRQENDDEYNKLLDLINDAESLIYKASFKLSEIEAENE